MWRIQGVRLRHLTIAQFVGADLLNFLNLWGQIFSIFNPECRHLDGMGFDSNVLRIQKEEKGSGCDIRHLKDRGYREQSPPPIILVRLCRLSQVDPVSFSVPPGGAPRKPGMGCPGEQMVEIYKECIGSHGQRANRIH